jgi:hypothetical protein
MRTGTANLPLHYGKAPRWLFPRMARLSREITIAIVEEYGTAEMLKRLSDPYWFQSFGCVLGYDWHSSGVTTTVCGALKEGLRGVQKELGFFVAGGKGGTSRKTPLEIKAVAEKTTLGRSTDELVYASKMSAKVDSSLIQDGYQLYHHNFFFTQNGDWTVVQQGMNEKNRYARRYHWNSNDMESFINEPQTKICDDKSYQRVLNLTAHNSSATRDVATELVKEKPEKILKEYEKIQTLSMPRREWTECSDIKPENLKKVLLSTYENQPKNFEELVGMKGVGAKSLRALTLISEVAYGIKADWQDPVKYSFAHGGKDGYPYPVDRETYDKSIQFLRKAIERAKLEKSDKKNMLIKLID